MSWTQVVRPNLSIKVNAGWCLMHTRMVFDAPAVEASAWEAWQRAIGRHTGSHPTNVAVPVFFSHWGTYSGIYKNWGHTVTYVPGRGYLSSPGSGYGAIWLPTIAAVERYFGAKYVGWATHISGVQVVRFINNPRPTPQPDWEDTLKAFSGRSTRKTKQTIRGGNEDTVTFLDSHSQSKFGDRTLARGPGAIVGMTARIMFTGDPGTRVSLLLVRETGTDKNRVILDRDRVTIDTFGRIVSHLHYSGYLGSGELIRVLAQPQSGKNVVVDEFAWNGMNRPG